jgi:uncharacterized delta-60 repeat protein
LGASRTLGTDEARWSGMATLLSPTLVARFGVAAIAVLLVSGCGLLSYSGPTPTCETPPPVGSPAEQANLDQSFGCRGTVTTRIGSLSWATDVAVQSDSRIIVAGWTGSGSSRDSVLVRYTTDGTLDPSFGSNGIVTTDMGGEDEPNAVALQPDGRIVVVGRRENRYPDYAYAVARYDRDGKLDPSFGRGGVVTTDFDDYDSATSVAIQPDGKIVVGGNALVRYDSDGSLDPSFGNGGAIANHSGSFAEAVALQPDGKIVVADGNSLLRYEPNGKLDLSFGTGGVVSPNLGVNTITLQPDGKIVIMVRRYSALVRYDSDGKLDSSFGRVGTAWFDFGVDAIAFLPDGRSVIAGGRQGEGGFMNQTWSDIVLARYIGS